MPTSASPFRVLKFGGAALADGPAVQRACKIIAEHGGERPVVIVSALEGVTALLEAVAEGRAETQTLRIRHRSLLHQLELSSELLDPFFRELAGLIASFAHTAGIDRAGHDHLLSFGERMSARIVAATLRGMGLAATPVDAHDLGLATTSRAGETQLLPVSAAKIRAAIAEVPGIPVVTGFLAADERGNLTTLGRNGSDLSALFVGEALGAAEVQLWKSVAGIQTADPRWVADARTLEHIGYDEVLEIARHGARVMHHGAARVASRAELPVVLRDVRDAGAPGTRLVGRTESAGPLAVVHRDGLLRARMRSVGAGELEELKRELAALGAPVLWLCLVEQPLEAATVELTLSDGESVRALFARRGADVEIGLASVTLVGPGVGADRALHAGIHDQFDSAGIAWRAAESTGPSNSRTWFVQSSDLARSLALLHPLATRRPAEGEIPHPVHP